MHHRADLMDDLIKHEGTVKEGDRHMPYKDTHGLTTIGYGRCLDRIGISESEAMTLLEHDVARLDLDCLSIIPTWHTLDRVRQDALMNMCFNLGRTGLANFKKLLAALEVRNWSLAAIEMLDSKWAAQVGKRATYLAHMIEFGRRPA